MNQVLTDPRKARTFQFVSHEYDPVPGMARLVYRFDNGPDLVESFNFPYSPWPPEASRQAAFTQALKLLHLLVGISYYKAGLCPELGFDGEQPDAQLAGFLTDLYSHGLAEFAYVNELNLAGKVHFEGSGVPPEARSLILPDRALVAMGGGKDSLVGLGLLIEAGLEVQPICVGGSPLIGETVKAAGLPLIRVGRNLAPELLEMNRLGAWNGHIPITAINSAVLLCAAILYGYKYIVFSNERSADEATLIAAEGNLLLIGDLEVNHQYSKSSRFEHDFRQIIQSHVSPDVEYFSILRPYSELEIVRRFSRMKKFHTVYSSCNRNFHIDGSHIEGRWCLDCPKCRFAALSLALFMSPAQVAEIMGDDLLNHEDQTDGYRALCGLGRDKPFECVGEAGESRAALSALTRDDAWRNHAVVKTLAPELAKVEVPEMHELLRPSDHHFIPDDLRFMLT